MEEEAPNSTRKADLLGGPQDRSPSRGDSDRRRPPDPVQQRRGHRQAQGHRHGLQGHRQERRHGHHLQQQNSKLNRFLIQCEKSNSKRVSNRRKLQSHFYPFLSKKSIVKLT